MTSSFRERSTPEGGFTILEVVIALSIMIAVAAVVAPNLLGFLDRARVDKAITSLENLAEAIAEFEEDVNEKPRHLTQLSSPITTSHYNICGVTFTPGNVGKWEGPYVNRDVTVAGVPLGIGTASDLMVRNPSSGNYSTQRIQVPNVTIEDAVAVNDRVDGDGDATTGTVRWTVTNSAQGLVALEYVIPIKGC